mmetsp:Transcript_26894/g.69157  ORF Transcript_26894/g.69157 Transcript_26894/m.69157 type:complete len:686 (-) Transcript_26894:383-2440(-)
MAGKKSSTAKKAASVLGIVLVAVASAEILFTSGAVYGFSSLRLILERERVYSGFCTNTTSSSNVTALDDGGLTSFSAPSFPVGRRLLSGGPSSSSSSSIEGYCREEGSHLDLMFTVASSLLPPAFVLAGIALDNMGPRRTHTLFSFVFAVGVALLWLNFTLLSSTGVSPPVDLIFIGTVMMGMAGPGCFLPYFHLANLFPGREGVIHSLLNTFFDDSVLAFFMLESISSATGTAPAILFLPYLCLVGVFAIAGIFLSPSKRYHVGDTAHVLKCGGKRSDDGVHKVGGGECEDDNESERELHELQKYPSPTVETPSRSFAPAAALPAAAGLEKRDGPTTAVEVKRGDSENPTALSTDGAAESDWAHLPPDHPALAFQSGSGESTGKERQSESEVERSEKVGCGQKVKKMFGFFARLFSSLTFILALTYHCFAVLRFAFFLGFVALEARGVVLREHAASGVAANATVVEGEVEGLVRLFNAVILFAPAVVPLIGYLLDKKGVATAIFAMHVFFCLFNVVLVPLSVSSNITDENGEATTVIGVLPPPFGRVALILAFVLFGVSRAFYYATMSKFVDDMYGMASFGRIVGFMNFVAGAAGFLQYPLLSLTYMDGTSLEGGEEVEQRNLLPLDLGFFLFGLLLLSFYPPLLARTLNKRKKVKVGVMTDEEENRASALEENKEKELHSIVP